MTASGAEIAKGEIKSYWFEKGQIDPCDDIPAFVGLSEVCKVTSGFLGITVTPLDADQCFLTRPGEKLTWAANQMRTQARATENQKEIAELKKLVQALLGKQVGVEGAQTIMNMKKDIDRSSRKVEALKQRVCMQGKQSAANFYNLETKINKLSKLQSRRPSFADVSNSTLQTVRERRAVGTQNTTGRSRRRHTSSMDTSSTGRAASKYQASTGRRENVAFGSSHLKQSEDVWC
jgi:hypothetical protein